MKKIIYLLPLLLLMMSCADDEIKEPTPSLMGTKWAAFYYTSSWDNEPIYRILYFVSDTEVEIYSARAYTDIVGEVITHTYSYADPALTITISGTGYDGTVQDSFIRWQEDDYEKQ